jgi:hypothetical protein
LSQKKFHPISREAQKIFNFSKTVKTYSRRSIF